MPFIHTKIGKITEGTFLLLLFPWHLFFNYIFMTHANFSESVGTLKTTYLTHVIPFQ
jgi:hypothetical protein